MVGGRGLRDGGPAQGVGRAEPEVTTACVVRRHEMTKLDGVEPGGVEHWNRGWVEGNTLSRLRHESAHNKYRKTTQEQQSDEPAQRQKFWMKGRSRLASELPKGGGDTHSTEGTQDGEDRGQRQKKKETQGGRRWRWRDHHMTKRQQVDG